MKTYPYSYNFKGEKMLLAKCVKIVKTVVFSKTNLKKLDLFWNLRCNKNLLLLILLYEVLICL